jgi:branched-chain amino acid transport system ATP-binding protein
MLDASSLNVGYGKVQVLWDVTMHVEQGEIVALLGSNGAGKSTLLKTIIGAITPMSGEIKCYGQKIDGLPPHDIVRKGISLVPEGRRLFPRLTVLENLRLGAFPHEQRGLLKETMQKVFEIFPILKERLNQFAGMLSGGEQQMLAIGRSLMSNPKILLLDEPSLGLAPVIIEKVFDVVREISRTGVTIVLAEQNAQQALELADRAYLFETGRVVFEGDRKKMIGEEYIRKVYLGM